MSNKYKIVFSGPMGAGKTKAIDTLSDVPVVSTEVKNTDLATNTKALTTVGMDYGELKLNNGQTIGLFGTPGQERFNFIWSILAEGALGVVILINHSAPDPVADLQHYYDTFKEIYSGRVVIGVSRIDVNPDVPFSIYQEWLEKNGINIPVYPVDMRKRDDVLLLVESIVASLEAVEFIQS